MEQQPKIVIESLLTGSQFEIPINEHDKILIVKSNLQKILGIPSNQLHLLHNQEELSDTMTLKDIPNFHDGIKLKLVLGMKVGPISSARRVPLSDYDTWFDDVIHQNSKREESLTIKTKYLVYKGCKKNVHRLWKMNGGGDAKGKSLSTSGGKYGKSSSLFGGLNSRDDDKIKKMTDQTIQENIRTTEKMNQLKLKMELVNARKKLKSIKFPMRTKNKGATDASGAGVIEKPLKQTQECNNNNNNSNVVADMLNNEKPLTAPGKTKDHSFIDKVIQKQQKPERNLSAESKMKIKENLSRNRSFKTILSQPEISTSSSSMSLFNNEMNPLEFCFATNADVFTSTSSGGGGGNKLGRSLSFQSNYIHRTDSNLCVNTSLATMEATTISNSTPIIQEYVEHIAEPPTGTKVKDPLPKTGYSTSMQDLLLQEFLTKSSTSPHFQLTPATTAKTVRGRDFSSANNTGSALKLSDEKVDMFKGTAITKVSPSSTGDEYFILPKLLIREDSPILEAPLGIVKESKTEDLLDVAAAKQPSAESLIEFYENLTSASTSSLASKINDYECFHQPPGGNRFYHSDLDLNQLNDRFKNNLSISNLNINTSEGNLGGGNSDAEWPRSNLLLLSINQTIKDDPQPSNNYNVIEDVNYDKFLNDLLNNDISSGLPAVLKDDCCSNKRDEVSAPNNNLALDSTVRAPANGKDNETIDLFTSDLDNVLMKKMTARRIAPMKKPIDKLKSFSSNPQLGNHHQHSHESNNLAATTSTTTVHIPQLSRLDAIPTKYRRGYINLNDACLSNSDLSASTSTKMPKTSDRKAIAKENPNSFHHGASIFHCRSSQNGESADVNDRISSTFDYFDNLDNNSSGRQSRFEYCNSYYSNLNQFASSTTSSNRNRKLSTDATNFDFQSEENLFNMNFDSFYEDFVDSAELSWSSTSSASSTSYDSSSISSMYDKKYVILPEIKLDNDLMRLGDKADEKALMVAGKQHEEPVAEKQQKKDASGKLRCFHCNKKLGIIMIMKCHCNQYFCAAHRFMEVHNCSYDYKEHGRKKLERENPLICTQKLPKI